jgi:hypothetical protein
MRFFVIGLFVAGTVAGVRLTQQVFDAVAASPETRPASVVRLDAERLALTADRRSVSEQSENSVDEIRPTQLPDTLKRVHSQQTPVPDEQQIAGTAGNNGHRQDVTGGPIRQVTPLHPQMLTPGNFEYLGGFRPPLVEGSDSKFSYGGWAVTYRGDGDPNGPDDGYPGSLYLLGFQPTQLVAEISIPRPCQTRSIDDVSVAELLQPFGDITGGIQRALTGGETESFEIGGMQVVKDRLHWTLFKYYNVAGHDYPSHGTSSLRIYG